MKHLIRNILFLFILFFLIWFFYLYILPYVFPFVLAGGLTVVMEPLVSFLQRKARLARAPAVALALIILIGTLGSLLFLFFGRLIAELIHFSASLPKYTGMLAQTIAELKDDAARFYFSLPLSVLEFIANNVGTVEENVDIYLNRLQAFTSDMLNYLITLISSVPGIMIWIFVSLVATFFMSKDRVVLRRFWLSVVPAPWGERFLQVMRDLLVALMGYGKAQLVLMSITFAETLIGLIIIDAPYALLMAIMIAIFDLIPVLGPSTVFLPWIFWEIINKNTFFAIKLVLLYVLVLGVRQVLEAKIVANAIGLHPLATLMSIYVGLQLLGVAGLIMGPLSLIVLRALSRAGILSWRLG